MKLFTTLAVFMLTLGAAPAQEKEDEPTEESIAKLQEAMDRLDGAFKEKSYDDQIHFSKAVAEAWKGGEKAQKGKAVKQLEKLVKAKKKEVAWAGIEALGKTGGAAAKILLKHAKSRGRKDITFLCKCIKAVGPLQDPKSIEALHKYLVHRETTVIAHAIDALGAYAGTPTKVRKLAFEDLSKNYSSVESNGTKQDANTADEQKFKDLYNGFERALKALSGQNISGAENWARWFRKEGKKLKEW